MKAKDVLELFGKDEIAEKALNLLLRYSEQGFIPADELKDFDLVLLLEGKRLALPIEADKMSLSWNMRHVQLQRKMEIPYIIRLFFKKLKSGEADVFQAIEEYFEKIGEDNPKVFVEIFLKMCDERDGFLVSGDSISKICRKYGKDGGVVIAEMKGAGIISPYIGCGKIGRTKSMYEINKFLLEALAAKISQL